MPIPSVSVPQSSDSYSYNVAGYESSLSEIEAKLGNKITNKYDHGEATLTKRNTIIMATVLALSILTTVGVILAAAGVIAASVAFSPLLGLTAIPTITIAIGMIVGLAKQKEDFDTPEMREKVKQKIATMGLSKIVKEYEFSDLVGYKLLDGIKTTKGTGDSKVYQTYERYANQYKNLKKRRNEYLENIDSKYSNAMRNARDTLSGWYNKQIAIIRQNEASREMIRQQNKAKRAEIAQRAKNNQTGIGDLYTLVTLPSASPSAYEYTESQIDRMYDNQIKPIRDWEQKELAMVKSGYRNAKSVLNQAWSTHISAS